ncbi:hypothetical protein ACFX16_005320 [Malus domestica]
MCSCKNGTHDIFNQNGTGLYRFQTIGSTLDYYAVESKLHQIPRKNIISYPFFCAHVYTIENPVAYSSHLQESEQEAAMTEEHGNRAPLKLEGQYKALVVCWFLGLGSLVAWSSMITTITCFRLTIHRGFSPLFINRLHL